jgi:phage/plasmid-associated DNA primase
LANMIELAKSEPGIPVIASDLDADPWLLNVQNGTLDLRTGELREPDPALLMTKCCATRFDPDARSELWEAFVKRTTGNDSELAAYVQRSLGYALFGKWREKAFWFGYGPPDGAKSTLLGVIGDVLGDYHVAAAASTWMVQNNIGGNRGDVTRLLEESDRRRHDRGRWQVRERDPVSANVRALDGSQRSPHNPRRRRGHVEPHALCAVHQSRT